MNQQNGNSGPGHAQSGSRILIIADDLTGGNACGALFAEAGLRTMTITDTGRAVSITAALDEYDAIVVNANSRHLPPAEAQAITEEIIRAAGEVDILSCRIDTTLRGNVGATAEAALRTQSDLQTARRSFESEATSTGGRAADRVVGMCIPAFPSSGRVTVGGRQLMHGRLLEDTELRHDVRSPVTTSLVADVLATGTDLECRTIDLSTVLSGRTAIRSALLGAIAAGTEVIIVDALTTEHVDLIGDVVAELTREIANSPAEATAGSARAAAGLNAGGGLRWVAIDPGPGTLALAQALLPDRTGSILFGVSGSATEVTRNQLAELSEDPSVTVMRAVLDSEGLPDVEATCAAVGSVTSARAIIVATVVDATDLRELSDEQSELIPLRLARIASEVIDSHAVAGLYTTGGDVTAAVLSELGAVGMEIDAEIIPLAVGGRIAGGSAAGLPIVTKGGLIGDSSTAAMCLDHLSTVSRTTRP